MRRHAGVPRGEPGVRRDDPGEAVEVLRHETQSDEAAPVLPHEHDVTQVEDVEREGTHPFDVPRVGVIGHVRRLVGAAESHEVGRDGPKARLGEHGEHLPVEEGPARLAVEQ